MEVYIESLILDYTQEVVPTSSTNGEYIFPSIWDLKCKQNIDSIIHKYKFRLCIIAGVQNIL